MIKKTLQENKKKILAFILVLTLGLPLAFVLAYFLAFHGRIYPRIWTCRIPLSGRTAQEAEAFLVQKLQGTKDKKIILKNGDQKFPLNLEVDYLPKETALKAYFFGRNQSPLKNIQNLFKTLREGKSFAFELYLNENELDAQIASISAQLYTPAINPQIKVIENGPKRVRVERGENGREVDHRQLKKVVYEALVCPQRSGEIQIPLITISPKISASMAEETQKRAEKILGQSLKLTVDDRHWRVEDEEIINLISFEGGFSKDKINKFAKDLAQSVNLPPENAAFQFENGRVSVFKPSREGITLKEDLFVQEFEAALNKLMADENGSGEEKQTVLELPVVRTQAKISTADVNSLGIKELLGRGTSLYTGSISNRVYNLTLASKRLNGVLIGPGEEFSFNQSLGEISTTTGYKQAYIIKEGRTILGDGGGVCQVSTTLFRAALKAGLPITERQAHAYRVSYYEQDVGPGFDATVFDPAPDLKFKNDTPAHILIQTKVDTKNKMLIFDLYGTGDGRTAETSKVRLWDRQAPPPDLYLDDPALPAGTVKQIEHKIWGAKVAFDYKVSKDGETVYSKTFYSYYKPWQAVYLRGTR